MVAEICFDGYLRSLVSAYQQWWRLYTLTDATGRESQQVKREQTAPAFFDFGLMVQTVDKEKVESQKEKGEEEKKEKNERLPVLEGICKYAGNHDLGNHVLLVGRPGSGKSTALARLLLQEAENALNDRLAKIPVLVELRYLPSEANESSVCDRILAFMHKHDPALDIDEAGIKQLLRQGRLLLLVDGVNELPSDRGRVMVNQFRELYQKTCPMIFTTRELSAGGDLGIAKRLEMQPLTEPQMQQFVMAYLPTQGEKLLRQLSGRLREFGQTPLLLWMLCEVFKSDENNLVNLNLGKIFQVFTKAYVTSSIRNHQVSSLKGDIQPLSDHRLWSNAMKYLASLMMDGDSPVDFRVVIRKDEIIQKFTVLFKDEIQPAKVARDCLDDLLNYHLIQNRNADNVEFLHQLIQEYYAAEWLLGLLDNQQISYERLQHDYLNYLKWTESLALMLALVEDNEQAVRVVRLALDVDLRLGARLAGAVKFGVQEKTVGLLLREIEERKIPQEYAIEILAETRSDKTVEPLILALKDSDDWVRIKAVEALGNIGSDKAVDPLIPTLNESHHNVRCEAAKALGNIGSDKAVDPLIQLFNSDEYLHKEVAEALAHIGSDKAVEFLIQLRNSDKCLLENALEVLTNIRSQIQYVPTKETWVSDETIDALNDSDDGVRRDAAEALGKISSDKAVEPLIEALKDLDNYLRMRAVEALGKIGSDKVIEPLIQSLKDSDDFVRMSAVEALGKIGSDKVIEPLIQSLKDLDDFVLRIAVEALGKIGSDKAVNPLIQTFKDKDPYVRWRVLEALGKIGSDKAVEPLIEVLKYLGDDDVRWRVLEALGKIGSDKAVNPLIEALKDKDPYVRRSAVEALGRIADIDRNLPVLTQQLPYLLTLIPTKASQEALSVITAIQSRCKYYNYNIAQTPLPKTDTSNNTSSGNTIVNNIQAGNLYMSDTSKPNVSVNISGGQFRDFVTGDKTIHGDEIETQNNYYGADDTQQLANELDEILQGIVPQISDPTSEAGKEIITAAAMEEIENKPTLKDRLVAALTAGAFEAIKKIAKNDFVEVFLVAFKAGLEAKPKK